MKEEYIVTIMFRDETDRVHRKEFKYKADICNSLHELMKWAEKFGAEKIIFRRRIRQNG